MILRVSETGEVDAPASDVYWMIADYRNGHRHIVPPEVFSNLLVESGSGYGDGTMITYDVRAFGQTIHSRARVTEPQPGRVLVETDLEKGGVTTFTVEPIGSTRSRVTIATDLPTRSGFAGVLERALSKGFLRKTYLAEIARLNDQVKRIDDYRKR